MISNRLAWRLRAAALVLPLALFLSACDNPVEEEDDHPAGVAVLDEGNAEVARRMIGEAATGELSVGVGASRSFRVVAVSEGGQQLAVGGGEFEVRVGAAPANAGATIESGDRLRLTGTTAGNGTLQLEVWHGSHRELTADLPVVVQ